jgi:hypothetical protein
MHPLRRPGIGEDTDSPDGSERLLGGLADHSARFSTDAQEPFLLMHGTWRYQMLLLRRWFAWEW